MKLRKSLAILLAAVLSVIPASGAFAAETPDANAAAIDKEAFDALIASGEIAEADDIAENKWASAVKEAGVLRVGGTRTSFLFSQLDETDNGIRGFDAGLYQLLARYILGDESKFELTQVDSSTRESVLQSDQVDAVFATYSITDARKEVISFAGPYYTSRQAVLVKAGNTEITGVDYLAARSSPHRPDPPARISWLSSLPPTSKFRNSKRIRKPAPLLSRAAWTHMSPTTPCF